ncbi:MAG TPA: copper resistance protein CopC [Ktedonobacteraceae bacterium]|jgi:methionine-rich copper-binding protein CopC
MKYTIRRSLQGLSAILFSLGLLLVAFVGTASAHAKVTQSDPAINSTIATAPSTITVTALENINPDPKKSNLFVYGPSGELISQGNATVPLNNPKNMSIKIKPDGNGVYVVHWVTVSADDGDPDEGAFVFTVKAGGATATAPAQPTPAQPTTNPVNTNTNTTNSNSPLVPAAVTGIIALLVGLGGGFFLGRNRTSSASELPSLEKKADEDIPSDITH